MEKMIINISHSNIAILIRYTIMFYSINRLYPDIHRKFQNIFLKTLKKIDSEYEFPELGMKAVC